MGGEHVFALRLGELRALQDARGAGPEEILSRIRGGTWRIDDLIEVLRLGLIGGEMDEIEAQRLVISLFDLHPPLTLKLTAFDVLLEALSGPEDDKPGKATGAEETAPENGAGAQSTETPSPSA